MADPRTGKTSLLRDLNLNIVLNIIAQKGPLSRVEVVRHSGLPRMTVSRITNEFLEAGLILEKSSEESSGGRPPLLIQLKPDAGYTIGVKLDKDSILVVLCNLQGTILDRSTSPLSEKTEFKQVVAVIVETIQRCLQQAHIPLQDILGVGVGLHGMIDVASGICHYSPVFSESYVPLATALEAVLHIPVRIDNAINTLAVAEKLFGFGQAIPNFLLLIVGQDIGLSVILNGQVYHGQHGYAGAFAHFMVDYSSDAPLCTCGKRGCFQAIISSHYLAHIVNDQALAGQPIDQALLSVIAKSETGDEQARYALEYIGTMLGIAIANLINIFDPDKIFMIGHIDNYPLVWQAIQQAIARVAFDQEIPSDVFSIIDGDVLKDEQWAYGAACLVLHELFQPPLYESEQRTMIVVENLLARTSSRLSLSEQLID